MVAADERLLLWINNLVGKSSLLDSAMRVVVNDYFIAVSLSLALVALWFVGQSRAQREHHQRVVLCGAISLGITNGIVKIINLFYDRPRPFQAFPQLLPTVEKIFYPPHDPSFPSNGAAVAFAIATAVWLGNRRLGAFLYLLAFLFSFARVYAGVHYPLDVVGGAAIGILTSYLIFKLLRFAEPLPSLILRLARRLYLA